MSLLRPGATAGVAALAAAAAGCLGDAPTGPGTIPECADPVFDASEWQSVQGATFDFRVPPNYERPTGTARWESGRMWVLPQGLKFGELPTDPPVTLTQYSECTAEIGGHEALIQLGATASTTRLGLGWYLSATWEGVPVDADDSPGYVLFEAWTPNDAFIVELESIFFTVDFFR